MKWLINLLAPWKSELFALVGVLAVCGIGTTIAAWLYSRAQADTITAQQATIDLQAQTNEQWAKNWDRMQDQRRRDQQAVIDLQAQLGLISDDNDEMAASIKELEKSNADVRDYLSGKLPDELRRVLQRQ